MIIHKSYGALLIYGFGLIGADCLRGSTWRCVYLTHFQESVSPTVHSAESGLPSPHTLWHPPPPHSAVYMPLTSPRPIYSHLLWPTVGLNRATNRTGSLKESGSNLKVRAVGFFCGKVAGSNLIYLILNIYKKIKEYQQLSTVQTLEPVTVFCLFYSFLKSFVD